MTQIDHVETLSRRECGEVGKRRAKDGVLFVMKRLSSLFFKVIHELVNAFIGAPYLVYITEERKIPKNNCLNSSRQANQSIRRHRFLNPANQIVRVQTRIPKT